MYFLSGVRTIVRGLCSLAHACAYVFLVSRRNHPHPPAWARFELGDFRVLLVCVSVCLSCQQKKAKGDTLEAQTQGHMPADVKRVALPSRHRSCNKVLAVCLSIIEVRTRVKSKANALSCTCVRIMPSELLCSLRSVSLVFDSNSRSSDYTTGAFYAQPVILRKC